jgi:hypothetical protein
MIIFELTLTPFEESSIFCGSWGRIKNWLELKIKPPLADLVSLKNTVDVEKESYFSKYAK